MITTSVMKESRKNSWIFYTWKYKTDKDWSESEDEEQSKICKEGATEGVPKKRCFLKFYKFHRKKPLLESLFYKITGLKACNFIKKRFRLSCFPAKSAKLCYFEEYLKTTTSVYTFLSRVISSIVFFSYLAERHFGDVYTLCYAYRTSDNETPPISRVLIGRHLIFHALTSSPYCNSYWKCTPVKYKKRQKARFPIVT